MKPHHQDESVLLYHGDCVEVMRGMGNATVDSVVTDPPYGLEFMGKEWDSFRGDAWRTGAGMSSPGIGERNIDWPSFGGGDSANATCATCGGRMRGARQCECAEPEWRVKGEPLEHRRNNAAQMLAFQLWCQKWAEEAFRVLKPGGYLLAFGGTRTYHRLATGIEDAGFEIRDSIDWIYGSGFPKSLNVAKAIDKAAGVERPVVGVSSVTGNRATPSPSIRDSGIGAPGVGPVVNEITASVTPEAQRWDGWGTALKPAHEPIVVARKPLVGSVTKNVLTYGTGAMNIDANRVAVPAGEQLSTPQSDPAKRAGQVGADLGISGAELEAFQQAQRDSIERTQTLGRWPTNVVISHADGCQLAGVRTEVIGGGAAGSSGFVDGYESGDGFVGSEVSSPVWDCVDDCPVRELDRQSGVSVSRIGSPRSAGSGEGWGMTATGAEYADAGGASRYFPTFRYEPKPASSERHAGMENVTPQQRDLTRDPDAPGGNNPRNRGAAEKGNFHPTVKPVELMRWLVKLVTPPGGTVLEPFAGSGTTAEACVIDGYKCVAIEQHEPYLDIIVARISKPIALDLFGGLA